MTESSCIAIDPIESNWWREPRSGGGVDVGDELAQGVGGDLDVVGVEAELGGHRGKPGYPGGARRSVKTSVQAWIFWAIW